MARDINTYIEFYAVGGGASERESGKTEVVLSGKRLSGP